MTRIAALGLALAAAALATAPAYSMTIKNADPEVRRIVITEGSERTELDVLPNETIAVCEGGCFITFPNGALTAYEGSESIVIQNGGPALPF